MLDEEDGGELTSTGWVKRTCTVAKNIDVASSNWNVRSKAVQDEEIVTTYLQDFQNETGKGDHV